MARGGRERGRSALTRESILAEALSLVDEEGLDACSFRTLGARLGVSQTAFYRHVPDKAALLDGIVELIWREVLDGLGDYLAAPPVPDGWRGLFERYAHRLRAVLLTHPNAVLLMLTHPITTPQQLAMTASALVALERAGYTVGADTLDLITAVTVYTTGFTAAEAVAPVGGAGGEPSGQALDEACTHLSEPELAVMGRLLAPMTAAGERWGLGSQFAPGLRALLQGWTPRR